MADTTSTPYISPANPSFQCFRGDLITVDADAPLPPGSRVEFELILPRADKTVPVIGKVAKVSAQGAVFRIQVRVHSLSREVRAALTDESVS